MTGRHAMKFLGPQLEHFLADRTTRSNVASLARYLLFLGLVITLFAVTFHFVMLTEGQRHSWLTGFYWTLTVMSTLGFGDITFHSDLGRLFSIVVLLTGIMMLLIVLPFTFIRHFYAPWLETQIRMRAPREVPPKTRGHVLICDYDSIAPGLVERLRQDRIPHFVVDSDPASAASRWVDGISVVTGDLESSDTYRALRAEHARLILANRSDTVNTNITLTVREVAPETPIVAIARRDESVDVLELSGAGHVLPLKRWLGEQLAGRVGAGRVASHVIGRVRGLEIAELPVFGTPLVGPSDWASRMHELTGIHVIGLWRRGRLLAPDQGGALDERSVIMLAGTPEQVKALDDMIGGAEAETDPVLVVGGGSVGEAAIRALHARNVPVHLIDADPAVCRRLETLVERIFIGDAADYALIERAGVRQALSMLLTTNDDAVNIYLASYCRHLNPALRIVSRITHDRNLEAIHRAGADLVLSYAWLGVEAVMAIYEGRELVLLSEGLDLFTMPAPAGLHGLRFEDLRLRDRTGLTLLAVETGDLLQTRPPAEERIDSSSILFLLGTAAQRRVFVETFGDASENRHGPAEKA